MDSGVFKRLYLQSAFFGLQLTGGVRTLARSDAYSFLRVEEWHRKKVKPIQVDKLEMHLVSTGHQQRGAYSTVKPNGEVYWLLNDAKPSLISSILVPNGFQSRSLSDTTDGSIGHSILSAGSSNRMPDSLFGE